MAGSGIVRVARAVAANMHEWHPLRQLLLGYGLYITGTWVLLCLPIAWQNGPVRALDNLFTATSAVSTTGLATVNPPEAYSFFGELVILLGLQVGGMGYMTLGSFVLLMRHRELPELRGKISRATFALPEGFDLKIFLRHVVLFTLLIEVVGAAALFFAFRAAGLPEALWPAIFHSASSFCTAGFSIFPNSLESYRADFWVNAIVTALSCAGAVGFLVFSDYWLSLTGRRARPTITTRVIVYFTCASIALGSLLLFLVEPTTRHLPVGERLLTSMFQAMSALTTVGFNTHAIGTMHDASVLLLIMLMLIGASPSGTGGGLKSTTVSAGVATLFSVLRQRKRITFWGKRVPRYRLNMAYASSLFYLIVFACGGFLLLLVQPQPFGDVLFEVASALGTVGLSRGLTADLLPVGKLIVIVLMYLGRIGPLTFGLAVLAGRAQVAGGEEDLAV